MAFKSGLSMSKWAHKYLLLVAERWGDVCKKKNSTAKLQRETEQTNDKACVATKPEVIKHIGIPA